MVAAATKGPKDQKLATPPELFARIVRAAGWEPELDVCAEPHTAKCERFYTIEDDCLTSEWSARNWMNPPYNDIARFMGRALQQWDDHERMTLCLVPSRTSTRWFQTVRDYERHGCATIAFLPKRVDFIGSNGSPFEDSCVIGIGVGLRGLLRLEGDEQEGLFA